MIEPASGSADPLDRDRIVQLLARLDQRLQERGLHGELYVVGGAAVAVTIADRRVTRDVDVAVLDVTVMEEARALAVVEGLPPDWLNAAAAPWVPPTAAEPSADRAGLLIRYAPPEHLLAMKMVALRQQDAPDLAALIRHLGLSGASTAQFARLLRSAYGGEGLLAQVLGVQDHDVTREVEAIARRVAGFAAPEH